MSTIYKCGAFLATNPCPTYKRVSIILQPPPTNKKPDNDHSCRAETQ